MSAEGGQRARRARWGEVSPAGIARARKEVLGAKSFLAGANGHASGMGAITGIKGRARNEICECAHDNG